MAILVLVSASASAQDRAKVFGNVRFGETPARVAEAMSGIGLAPYSKAKVDARFPLDQTFGGILLGETALVMALFNDRGALEKMIVRFVTEDEDCYDFYSQFKSELQEKFGATSIEEAFAAAWEREDAGVKSRGLSLSVEEDLTVQLTYESASWSTESDRRRKLSASF
jgi:hypothetical protein